MITRIVIPTTPEELEVLNVVKTRIGEMLIADSNTIYIGVNETGYISIISRRHDFTAMSDEEIQELTKDEINRIYGIIQ